MGFIADLFDSNKKDEKEWPAVICNPVKPPVPNSYILTNDQEETLRKKLSHLDWMLNGYFKDVWGLHCNTPQEREKFVSTQNALLEQTIKEYDQTRDILGLPSLHLTEIPNEEAFNKKYLSLQTDTDSLDSWEKEKEKMELSLQQDKEKRRYDLECRRLNFEKELRQYETELKVQALTYQQQLEIEQLKLEIERLNMLLEYRI